MDHEYGIERKREREKWELDRGIATIKAQDLDSDATRNDTNNNNIGHSL